MYPASGSGGSAATAAKFQNRCGSPQFANDYPHPHQHQTTSVAVHSAPPGMSGGSGGGGGGVGAGTAGSLTSGGSMSMRHGQRVVAASHQHPGQMTLNHGGHGMGMGHNHTARGMGMGMGGVGLGHNHATLGHPHSHNSSHHVGGHVGSHLIFPDDMDSIEFCMPAAPSSSSASSQNGLGIGDQLLMGSQHGEAFTERRRRDHSRRSNHKMDVEQQVKWSRKNIAATMERFEPTTNTQSSSSTSSLDYGFAANVMTPSTSSATPSHGGGASNPSLHVAFNGGGGGGGGVAVAGGGGGSASGSGASGASGSGAAAPAAPFNHVYSYAYYEPGAAKCHTNVPPAQGSGSSSSGSGQGQGQGHGQAHQGHSKSPPRNSIRALLAKSFRSKSSSTHNQGGQSTSSSPSAEERDRHTYTTRYGTTENLYEEVSDQKIRKVLSDNRIASGSSAGNVKEEQRRVQHNHFRVLDELNLSLEALIMPPTPPDVSPSHVLGGDEPSSTSVSVPVSVSAGAVGGSVASGTVAGPSKTAQRPRRGGLLGGAAGAGATSNSSSASHASHASLENLSSTLNSMELKDHGHTSCINPEFDEGDLDSGFSGSGSSSGASYNESLRYYKSATPTGPLHHHQHSHNHNHMHSHQQQGLHHQQHHSLNNNTLPHNMRSCRSSTASGTSTSKSSMASCGEDQGIGMTLAVGGGGGGVSVGGGGALMMHEAAGGGGGGSLSPFNYPRRCSADQQRASGRSMGSNVGLGPGVGVAVGGMGGMGGGSMSSSSNVALSTGAKPKKNFWTMKP